MNMLNKAVFMSSIFILHSSFCLINSLPGQTVALVLSGGASKGGAHIGVIRALEVNHIPIHYIAGTSVGAIVGALYSAGYSPDEMEHLMDSPEFQSWASGVVDEKYIYYYRKDDPNASWISVDLNPKKKIMAQLPTNLVSTYAIDFEFMEILAPANAVAEGNFDSLMIPFRCVVADIDSTTAVIMRKGDLSTAVRASMSIPFVFSPMVVNKKLVFDGGMYNNFPVDVARKEFKPDVIIGSRVAERYTKPEQDDALSQLLVMLMGRQNDTIPFPRSVLLTPNLPKVGLLDFSYTDVLADSGYRTTKRAMDKIRQIVHDSVSPSEVNRRRVAFRGREPSLVFDSIHAQGLTKAQESYTRKILKHGKKQITIDELRGEYFRFIDEGFVKNIYPRALYNSEDHSFDLILDIRKADNFSIGFGGVLSLGTYNEAFLELKYKYLWNKALHFSANGYFGRFYTSARVAGRMDFNSRIPWYIGLAYTYNNFNYYKNADFFFDDITPNYIIENESFGESWIGFPVTSKGKLALNVTYALTHNKYYQSNVFSRYDTTDQTSFNYVSPAVCFDMNSLNYKLYANDGARLLVAVSYISGTEDMLPGSTTSNRKEIVRNHNWVKLKLIYDNYFESIGPVKFSIYCEGVLSNQPLFANYTSSLIYASAFTPVPESQTLFLPVFRATNYAGVGLKAVVKVFGKIDYRLEGYIFQPCQRILENQEDHSAYFGEAFSERSYMASTSLVYHSPLGPICLGVNYFDEQDRPFFAFLNFGYLIFNRRALP
jgi:NTE family protein